MNPNIHLKIASRCLTALGFWKWNFKISFITILYRTYYRLTLIFYVIVVSWQFIEMYMVFQEGLMQVSFLIGVNLLYVLGLVKVWVLESDNVKKLTRKIQVTEQEIVNSNENETKNIFWKQVQQNYAINIFFFTIGWTCNMSFCITPYLTELADPPKIFFDIIDNATVIYRPRPLPLPVWLPFDRYKYYKTAYFIHLLISMIIPLYLISADNFFFSLITFATGQIRILKSYITGLEKQENLKRELRKCLEYHKAIIIYVEDLKTAMNVFLLLDFAACGLQIAVIGFQTIAGELEYQMLTTVLYLITMLVQLYLFYWLGNEIFTESVNIGNAIWDCNWYDFDKETKSDLLLIMVRTQKPLALTVGPFYEVSTSTMMTIIRTGYSYAAVMYRIYSNRQ